MNPQIWWYLARSGGIVAWVLLVASVVWGVLLATRVLKPHDRPAWLLGMHRWLSSLAVTCTGLHLVALVADSYVHFGWSELFVPGASAWRTTAVAVGVVAFWLMALVHVSSLLMRRLPRRAWRGIHYASYAVVWLVSIHAGLAGTDATNRLYQFVALLLSIAAVTAAMVRVLTPRRSRRPGAGATEGVDRSVRTAPGTRSNTSAVVEPRRDGQDHVRDRDGDPHPAQLGGGRPEQEQAQDRTGGEEHGATIHQVLLLTRPPTPVRTLPPPPLPTRGS